MSTNPFEHYEKLIKELMEQKADLIERLRVTQVTIVDYMDGTWDGNDEGWLLVMENNEKVIEQAERVK